VSRPGGTTTSPSGRCRWSRSRALASFRLRAPAPIHHRVLHIVGGGGQKPSGARSRRALQGRASGRPGRRRPTDQGRGVCARMIFRRGARPHSRSGQSRWPSRRERAHVGPAVMRPSVRHGIRRPSEGGAMADALRCRRPWVLTSPGGGGGGPCHGLGRAGPAAARGRATVRAL
jgi:hypothetical protein